MRARCALVQFDLARRLCGRGRRGGRRGRRLSPLFFRRREDEKLDAAILGAPGGGFVRRNGLVGSVALRGETPRFDILQPFGSLQYNYHQPLAALAIDIGHHLTFKTAWNYYQYGEKSFVGPTDPRYFHANNETLSLRWEF